MLPLGSPPETESLHTSCQSGPALLVSMGPVQDHDT